MWHDWRERRREYRAERALYKTGKNPDIERAKKAQKRSRMSGGSAGGNV
jgi:hypothetical protein